MGAVACPWCKSPFCDAYKSALLASASPLLVAVASATEDDLLSSLIAVWEETGRTLSAHDLTGRLGFLSPRLSDLTPKLQARIDALLSAEAYRARMKQVDRELRATMKRGKA